jgi:SAM-dependent methyltransferase
MTTPRHPIHPPTGNQQVYETTDVVHHYVDGGAKLKPAEEAILRLLEARLRGCCLLDLGVGAGRTTPHLLAVSSDYLGVDYSAEMVAACRRKYPGVNFREGDARQLKELGRGKFDFIFFSFNGLDSIDGTGRAQVLREVHAALKTGGCFLFSSHNLRLPPARPWHPALYHWSRNPRTLFRQARGLVRGLQNYWRNAGAQSYGEGCAIFVDSGHEFRLLHYYVEPAEQVRQLALAGFSDIETFDRQGQSRTLEAAELGRTPHVHYLARKPGPA